MEDILYKYKALIVSVYDGDTVTADIDLGFRTAIREEKLRLNRINAPEIVGPSKPEGTLSRDFLRGLVLNKEVLLKTIKDKQEKYGRYLAEIFIENEQGELVNINDLMVKEGHAAYKSY